MLLCGKKDSEEKLKDLETFNKIYEIIISDLDLDKLAQNITDIAANKLSTVALVLTLLTDDKKHIYAHTISSGMSGRILRNLGNSQFKTLQPIDKDYTLTIKSIRERKPMFSSKVSDMTSPPAPTEVSNLAQRLYRMKGIVSVPIYMEDEPLGALICAFTKTTEEITQKEVYQIEKFANYIGFAISRSKMYERERRQVQLLTKQNKDLESLYTLTSNISKSLNVDVVSQTAVNSLPQDTSMIGAILNLFDEEKQELYVKAVTSNQTSYAVEKIIGNIKQYKIDINDRQFDENISRKAFVMDKIYSSTNLADFISPPVPKSMVPAIEKLLKISSVVLYPLKRRDKVIGTIAYFLTKEDYAQLPQNEKNLYATYTAQIASALENSFLLKNLEEARAKIEEAYKKEKDMMDILGHELRTPLTVARNAVLMIDMEFQKPQPDMSAVNDLLEKAKENIKREISTLQTVLSTTRLENDRAQINYVKVDAKDVVHDSIEALGREAEKKKLQIKTELPEKEIFAWAGREQIQEIMDNLLSNAIKYTEKGEITISITEEGDYISFRVKDTGEGVPENEIKNLGKKFHRVNPYVQSNGGESDMNVVRPGGTGIGLYVVKGYLEKMGGKFSVESKLGEGSVFTASLQKYSGQDLSAKTDKNT